MLRQYLLALSIVMLIETPQLTIMAFTFTSQFVLMFEFYWMPRKDRKSQMITIVNELTVMAINYHLFLLTDFTSTDIQTLTGNSVIYFTCGNVTFNIVAIFGPEIVNGVKRARRWCVHRKLRNKRRVAQK